MTETQLTAPLSEPIMTQIRSRTQQLVDTFMQRNWTPEERSELKTLVEYLEDRK